IAGWQAASGFDSGAECNRLWAVDEDSASELYSCCDSGASAAPAGCSYSTTSYTPNPSNYVYVEENLTDYPGIDLTDSQLEVHIGCDAPGADDYCFWDEINVTGYLDFNPSILASSGDSQDWKYRQTDSSGLDGWWEYELEINDSYELGFYSTVSRSYRDGYVGSTGYDTFEILPGHPTILFTAAQPNITKPNATVRIQANITDNDVIDSAYVNITTPSGTSYYQQMSRVGFTQEYYYNFDLADELG
ncbi:unnamed protein product, partial [marine sediment metagenome]